MVSEKLDRVLSAEAAAAKRLSEAEKIAGEILSEAKAKADESYRKSAVEEAEKIGRDSAKNEIFGMSAVIMKIIP